MKNSKIFSVAYEKLIKILEECYKKHILIIAVISWSRKSVKGAKPYGFFAF